VNKELIMMVRQLPPTDKGLPLEIYCFTLDKEWVDHETIAADIFDHVLATIPSFDLEIFEGPTGKDFQAAISAK
jgi:miniconductance mechanosensitive channel